MSVCKRNVKPLPESKFQLLTNSGGDRGCSSNNNHSQYIKICGNLKINAPVCVKKKATTQKRRHAQVLFFNVPNFISSLFCTAITKREMGGEGVSDILNLFLALLLLLNNSIKCIFTICTWRIIKGECLQNGKQVCKCKFHKE